MLEPSVIPSPSTFAANAPGSRCGWLTASEAAQYLGITTRTLQRWSREGLIIAHRLSGTIRATWRYRIEDLDARMLEGPAVLSSAKEI
jgi:excisionase family DNA binding protein